MIGRLSGPTAEVPMDTASRIREAAAQFESLLVSQMMKVAREARQSEENQTEDAIMEMAEQQLASAIAAGGGLGLAKLIVQGLNQQGDQATSSSAPHIS